MSDQNINNERIPELVLKHLLRQLTDNEQTELDQWRTASPENEAEFVTLTDRAQLQLKLADFNQVNSEGIWEKIKTDVPELQIEPVNRSKYVWFRIAVAAAVLAGFLIGGKWFLKNNSGQNKSQQTVTQNNDIAPGGNKAILTLGNGSQVVLDSARHGVLAQEGKTSINKMKDGEVIYNVNHKVLSGAEGIPLIYNTITTPRGGQYHVVLPDGSHVWLNAASSIHFPTQFTGHERKVELRGEAYFEIVKDKTKPFKVMVAPAGKDLCEIAVLGTHFNVNAYDDENYVNATLLEGRIQFTTTEQKSQELKPGQQAVLNKEASKISVTENEDAETSIAWVKGIFHFEKANINSVMRQLSRWYNVDVEYEGKIPEQMITGDAERGIPLSTMLQTLEKMTTVHFQMQGRSVKVMP